MPLGSGDIQRDRPWPLLGGHCVPSSQSSRLSDTVSSGRGYPEVSCLTAEGPWATPLRQTDATSGCWPGSLLGLQGCPLMARLTAAHGAGRMGCRQRRCCERNVLVDDGCSMFEGTSARWSRPPTQSELPGAPGELCLRALPFLVSVNLPPVATVAVSSVCLRAAPLSESLRPSGSAAGGCFLSTSLGLPDFTSSVQLSGVLGQGRAAQGWWQLGAAAGTLVCTGRQGACRRP